MDNNLKFSDDGDKLPPLICIITGKGELKESKPEVFISPILMLFCGGGGQWNMMFFTVHYGGLRLF